MPQSNKYEVEFKEYNSRMKRLGFKQKTWKEYMDYCFGNMPKVKKPKPYIPPQTTYRRESPVVPSGNGVGIPIDKKKEKVYTGDLIKGIIVTHKSNLIPVSSNEDILDVSRMRR
jgi:hypothetical protein